MGSQPRIGNLNRKPSSPVIPIPPERIATASVRSWSRRNSSPASAPRTTSISLSTSS
jgi:hypothetical protein